jgi:hypothetical protein
MSSDRDSSGISCRHEGRYANYFAVGYNEYEFVIDFGQSYFDNDAPESPELCTRIITGPAYAKAFLKMLQDSIATFETTYGRISDKGSESPDY